jgi:uncharacterized protein with HEPN domain
MSRDFRLYLDDILEAIERIQEYTQSMDYSLFAEDRKTQDAVARNLEIIGEAAGKLPESVKSAAPGTEWRKIIGLRNVLVHEYFGISPAIVWDVICHKLVPLEKVCHVLLAENERSDGTVT